jgi:dTDP-4-amino-4,6-dideoxygalactose transaminase
MDEINAIAKKHNLKVIEDGAQAIGVQYKDGRKVGNHGDIGCFSFFPSKNLGCFGDGGLVITNDDELGAKLRIMRVHGGKPKYYHKIIGGNFRLDAIQAAVLNVKLPHLDSWSEKRRKNAGLYTKLFIESGAAGKEGVTEFSEKEKVLLPGAVYKNSGHKNYHIYNQYVIRVQNRDDVRKHLAEKEISTEIYYPVPFHKQECFANLKSRFENTSFVNSEKAANETIALPIYPELSDEQIKFVVDSISEFVKSK